MPHAKLYQQPCGTRALAKGFHQVIDLEQSKCWDNQIPVLSIVISLGVSILHAFNPCVKSVKFIFVHSSWHIHTVTPRSWEVTDHPRIILIIINRGQASSQPVILCPRINKLNQNQCVDLPQYSHLLTISLLR